MKKFLVFSGVYYYPYGGWDDYRGSFDSVEDAKKYIRETDNTLDKDQIRINHAWWQIVDVDQMKVIQYGYEGAKDAI